MRIERRPSNGRVYLVAVEEVYRAGRWRKRIVVSFGNEANRATQVKLQGFLHALEGTDECPKFNRKDKP